MHSTSMADMKYFRENYLDSRAGEALTILDLGSMDVNGSYRELFDRPQWRYIGVDMTAGNNVDIVLQNPYAWREVGTDSIDVLISGQAFEHMEYFWITILEIARILKPGGICCIIAPSSGYEHRYPVDCWRFYPDGFAALARFARLRKLEVFSQNKKSPKDKDDDDRWRNTVLIAQKYRLSYFYALRQRLLRWLMHRMLTYRLPR